ncbi:hypothetical protein POVWA2_014720 [Plasmodium ovale wallikeri]|uniref:Uncharacterized protein n=1 Tax=Plasmodium ovale wallikeri TaxID=864142 RepID=A0A1A8YN62_PLAOA|nr:hypothetical protein POVWA1_015070 [Plasmodium ovale wallikeri]SBT33426.1 hypothetical protein POVWA2_014720 [Plasmodium ovale wallikeri]
MFAHPNLGGTHPHTSAGAERPSLAVPARAFFPSCIECLTTASSYFQLFCRCRSGDRVPKAPSDFTERNCEIESERRKRERSSCSTVDSLQSDKDISLEQKCTYRYGEIYYARENKIYTAKIHTRTSSEGGEEYPFTWFTPCMSPRTRTQTRWKCQSGLIPVSSYM